MDGVPTCLQLDLTILNDLVPLRNQPCPRRVAECDPVSDLSRVACTSDDSWATRHADTGRRFVLRRLGLERSHMCIPIKPDRPSS